MGSHMQTRVGSQVLSADGGSIFRPTNVVLEDLNVWYRNPPLSPVTVTVTVTFHSHSDGLWS